MNMRNIVLKLAWPVVLQNLLMTMMLYVDTIMLGRYSQTSLAAMGVTRPLVMSIRIIFMAVAIGTLATVARAFGECNAEKTRQQAATSIWTGIVFGVIVSVCGVFAAPYLISIYVDKAIQPELWYQAMIYLKTILSVFGFTYIFLVGSSILRACGDTKSPLLIAIYANLFNIFGNYCLIYGNLGFPEMGIEGAALSTALADVIEGVLFLTIIFLRKDSIVKLKIRHMFQVKVEHFKTLFKVSIPAAVEPALIQIGMLSIYTMVASLGEIAIASHQIVLSIESLSFMPGMGFSVACSALVGQNLGARRIDLAESAYRESLKIAIFIMSVLGLMFILFPGYLVSIFIDSAQSPQVAKLAAVCLMIGAIEEPLIAWAMIHQGVLRGSGDTKSSALVAFVGVWLVRFPIAYLFIKVFGWGLIGLWITMPIDWFARCIVFRMLYLKGRWKRVKM
jgi:putative MATE family efflux protein